MRRVRRFRVSRGDVLHVDVPGKGRHIGIVIDHGPQGEVVIAVATSGDWKTEPLRREIDFSAEPARSWIGDWPRDNGAVSYFYGDFIDVYAPDAWIKGWAVFPATPSTRSSPCLASGMRAAADLHFPSARFASPRDRNDR